MSERVYTNHPALYDAIQAEWDYDRDVRFVRGVLERRDASGTRLLEVGCGTGEHTRRFLDDGFEVTAVDKHEGMLTAARGKLPSETDAVEFRQCALPAVPEAGPFDVAVAIRGVINHVPPDDLAPSLRRLLGRLAPDGVLIFDNSPLPPEGTDPGLDVGTTERGRYVRVAQHVPADDGRLDWNEAVFLPDRRVVLNSRRMTPFEDGTIAATLERVGASVESYDGYGPDDDRTVFVATRS